jgi:hypothetical protein
MQPRLEERALYQYISMSTPPENYSKGESTKDWPHLKVALLISDGFKPNSPNWQVQRWEGTT